MYVVSCGVKPVEIDETDYHLLNELAEKGRAPLIELAERLGCSSQSVNYRIKNLVKSGVINAFRVNVDYSKLDLHKYKVDIYLKDHKLKKPILNYLKDKPYIEYMNLAMGWADLEPEFVAKNMDELLKIIDEINSNFSGAIKNQSFFVAEKFHKLRCIPEREDFS
jgi:DNA-binding Lrp family transcriptional regulator